MGGISGQASDMEIHAREILRIRDRLNEILHNHTKKGLEQLRQDTDRDFIMDAVQAREYGIIDQVISSHEKAEG